MFYYNPGLLRYEEGYEDEEKNTIFTVPHGTCKQSHYLEDKELDHKRLELNEDELTLKLSLWKLGLFKAMEQEIEKQKLQKKTTLFWWCSTQ